MNCPENTTKDKTPFAYPAFSEIQGVITCAAKMLGISQEEVKVMEGWSFPSYHMTTDYMDYPVNAQGLFNEMPFIQLRALHNKHGFPGYGMILYECRLARHLKYIFYHTKNNNGANEFYVFCKAGDQWKIIRNCCKMAKLAQKNEPPILKEGLLDNVVQASIHFLLNSKKVEKYGVRIKRGLLLDGPPGNGKTMACRYIQRLCTNKNINWGVVTASDIDSAYNDNKMDDLFNRFTVTFFDDIDISYLSRKEGAGKIACSILTAMDGMSETHHCVRIFTTNEKIDALDEAFVRPGRIDRRFTFDKPNSKLRRELLTVWPKEIIEGIGGNQGCKELVKRSRNFSFAEMEAIRANLVTNFLFGEHIWNLNKAFEDFKEGAGSFRSVPALGFGGESGASGAVPQLPQDVPALPAAHR